MKHFLINNFKALFFDLLSKIYYNSNVLWQIMIIVFICFNESMIFRFLER